MRYKRLPGEYNIFRIPRRGAPPEECPLKGGEEVPFLDCLECEYFVDFHKHQFSHCGIKEETELKGYQDQRDKSRQEREEIHRQAAERQAQREEEDRRMREEMAAMRKEMEDNWKHLEKEIKKDEEVFWKEQEEWREVQRSGLASLYGERLVAASESEFENKESDESDEDEEEEEEW